MLASFRGQVLTAPSFAEFFGNDSKFRSYLKPPVVNKRDGINRFELDLQYI